MHLHFDPVGGLAGDMFAAALLDAFPEHADRVIDAVRKVTQGDATAILHPFRDHAFVGRRFEVRVPHTPHEHTGLGEIKAQLGSVGLSPAVRDRAVDIFALLAEAEADVHGVPIECVTFHEVGALDSIADIVAAATLVEAIGPATYSIGALPLGSGRVDSAHGILPIPAPAVVSLLSGFLVHDDGIPGERVTPTGAAVMRQMRAEPGPAPAGRLHRQGFGFGTRKLQGLSNVLRVLVLEPVQRSEDLGWLAERVALIGFEVDDQSPEDLALGLEQLRGVPGVLDVVQMPATGKKGRMAMHVQILTAPDARDAAIRACFEQTTTLGLRHTLVDRAVLRRNIAVESGPRVKVATRPSGRRTVKPESDDLAADTKNRLERDAARRRARLMAATEDTEQE